MIRPLIAALALGLAAGSAMAQTKGPPNASTPEGRLATATGEPTLPPANAPQANTSSRPADGRQPSGVGVDASTQPAPGTNTGAPTTGAEPTDALPHGGMSPYGKPLPKAPVQVPVNPGK